MKKHLKRVLSMILAMVMVMGMLPMNVFAVEMLDGADDVGQAEVPVLEPGDIAGLQGDVSFDGEEQPEIPPDPSNDPGDLTWTNTGISSITINEDGSWEVKIATDTKVATTTTGTWVLALVPEATANGKTTTPSQLWAAGGIGSTRDNETSMTNAINGATGLVRDDHFIVVSGNIVTVTEDPVGSGQYYFVIRSDSSEITTTKNRTLPTVNELVTALGVAAPVEMRAFFYCKGSDTKVVSDVTDYGEPSKGLPHTVYVLNKTQGTLIYVGGTLEGADWAPDGVAPGDVLVGDGAVGTGYGTWDGVGSLTIPVYNVTGETVNLSYTGATFPDSTTLNSLSSQMVDGGTGTASFTVGADSGTINVPITGTGTDNMYTGSITVYVDNGMIPVTADPIDLYVTKGDKSMETTPLEATINFHYPSSYIAYSDDADGEGNPGFLTEESVILAMMDISADADGSDFGFALDETNYSLETVPPDSTYDVDFEMYYIDLTSGTFKVKLGTYDAGFDDVTVDGTVLTVNLTIAGSLTTWGAFIPGPNEVVVPVRIHVTVPEEETYTVAFDTNAPGTDCTPSPASVSSQTGLAAGEAADLSATLTDTQGHYKFLGWSKSKSGGVMTSYNVDAADADASNVITLYAKWEEITYAVEYADSATGPKYGEGSLASSTLPTETPKMKDATVTVKAGPSGEVTDKNGLSYTFKEWTTSDATIASGSFTMPEKKVTLTASWDPVMLDVTYAYGTTIDGKTSETVTGAVQKGDDYTVAKNAPGTWAGHTFAGWKLTSGTGTAASDAMHQGDKVTDVTTAITLTAQWTVNGQAIHYVWGDVTPFDHTKDPAVKITEHADGAAQYGGDYTLEATTGGVYLDADKKAWTLTGWKVGDNAGNTGDVLTNDGTTAGKVTGITGDVTLTAQWTEKKYTVTYQWDSKGALTTAGDSPVALTLPTGNPFAVQQGAEHTVSTDIAVDNTLYLDSDGCGWNFAGWTTSDATISSGKFTMPNKNVTLTASWTPVNVTVKFNANGGSAAEVSKTVQYGATTTAPTSAGTREHYSFANKWTDSGEADGTAFSTSTKFTADATFKAVWTGNTYTLTYNLKGGSGTFNQQSVTYPNTEITIHADEPTKVGNDFKGWDTDSAGATVVYTAGGKINITADTTLYAVWETSKYSVTYAWGDIAGGEPIKVSGGAETLPTESNPVVEHGKNYTVTDSISKTTTYLDEDNLGWTLKGWKLTSGTATTAVDTVLDPKGTVQGVTSDITLTAVWEKKEYNITFNKNGGTFDDGTTGNTIVRKVQHGAAAGEAPDVSRTDFTLIDWNTNASGGGTVFDADALVTASATYYARWLGDTADIVVTVTLDDDPYAKQTVALKGQAYTATESPDGTYTFSGIPVGSYIVVVNSREVKTVTISKGVDGSAEAKFWTVTANVAATGGGYVAAGASAPSVGTDTTDSVIVYDGETAYVNAAPATDYKFSTWSDNVSGTATTAANSVTNVTDTTTVTATFVKKTGSIVVQARLDNTSTAHNFPNGTVVTIVPHGVTLGDATDAQKKTQSVSNTTTGSVTFANLEHDSTAGWDIYVGTTKIADGDNVLVTGNDGSSVTKNAMYYTVTVKTGGNGDASVTDGTNTAETDYVNSAMSDSIVVLEQTSVTWAVGDAKTDFAFQNWDGTETSATAYQNVSMVAAATKTHTANFSKVSFTIKAVVNLNEVAQAALSDDITAIKAVRTDGAKDPESKAFTYDETEKKWVVSGLPSDNTYKVVVTTLTGDFDISAGIKGTDTDNVTGSFFTVETAAVADCEDNQAVMAVTTPAAASKTKVVVKSGTSIALTVDPADGYTHAGWTETNTSNKVSSNAFTPTDVTTAGTGITLMPTYTYEVPVELRYDKVDGDLVPGQTVTVTGATVTGKTTDDGTYVVSGMTPNTTYNVVVNGYASELTLADTMASTSTAQVVILRKITAVADPTEAGTPTVNGKTATEKVCYVPNKAAIPATGATAVTVAVPAANTGYRWLTASGETLWTLPETDTTTSITTATATSTTITSASVEADITVTAHAAKQWTVNVVNGNKDAGTLTDPVVSKGTAVAVDATSGNSVGNLVDDQETITVDVTPVAGWTPTWTVTKPDGTELTGKIDAANGGEVTVDQDMVITVTWAATKYDVEVTINLNNDPKTDIANPEAPAAPILYLKKGSEDPIPLTHKADGVYTAKVVPGNYDIYSPVTGTTVDTLRNLNFSIADGEGTGTAANLKKTLNYYTVTIDKKFSDDPDSAPTNVFAGHGGNAPTDATAEAAAKTKTILAGEGTATTTVGVAATSASTSAPYYRWDRWDEGSTQKVVSSPVGNYTMPGENALIAGGRGDDGITLTAVFQRQFKVTLNAPAAAGSSAAPSGHVQAKFGNDTKYSNGAAAGSTYALVDAGSSLNITALALRNSTEQSNYIFSAWSVDKTGDTANGTFAASSDTGVGSTVFTPTADAVVTPSYWLTPTLDPTRQTYHLNFGPNDPIPVNKRPATDASKTNNTLPTYTWTANDAELDGVYITIDGTETKLTKGTEYTMTDAGVIVFQDDYMRKNLKGSNTGISYDITVKSKTPAGGTQTDKAGTLVIYVTPDQLLSVTIKVNADKAASTPYDTLNLTEGATTEGRKTAIYKDHEEASITKENKLTFTWYYGDTVTTPESFEDTTTSAKDKATAKVTGTYKGTALTTTQAGLTNEFSLDGTVIPNAILNDANLKGKYIYAVVEASVTGKGAVITNAIPVDYDAAVKVRKDDSFIANADNGHYKVYLVRTGVSPVTAAGALTEVAGDVVATTYDATTGTYQTAPSALTGGASYSVYVNKVENDFTAFVDTKVGVTTQVNAAATDKIVDFYSVNQVNTTQKNATDSAGTDVPEHFDALPGLKFYAQGVTADFASGTGVLTGTAVTAVTNGTWTQDYDANWGKKADAGNTAPDLSTLYGTQNQPSADAADPTKGYSAGQIAAKTWIGAQLDQNVYTVTGNIWVIGGTNGAGVLAAGDDVPTLTSGGHVFKPSTTVGLNGNHRSTVTFTVPRSTSKAGSAITEQYVLKAKEKPGSTIIKFIPGQTLPTGSNNETFSGVAALTDDKLAAITADSAPAFTIVVEAASYVLHVDEVGETSNKHAEHDLPYADTKNDPGVADSGNSFAQRDWVEDYADFEAKTYTITVSNQGNTRLDVDLNIKKSVTDTTDTANNGYVYGHKAAATGDTATDLNGMTDDFNKVVFADLLTDFVLEPKGAADGADSKTFKVTIPKGLAVKLAADYAFEFTSIQAGTDAEGATKVYGPSVTYKLTQEVDPLEITAIMAKQGGDADTFVVDETKLTVGGVTDKSAIEAKGVDVDAEVEYTWWSGPYADSLNEDTVKAAFNANNGTFDTTKGYAVAAGIQADGSFKYGAAADQGKAIYVVARPKNILAGTNTGNVVKAVFNYPTHVNAPYDLQIKVNENTNPAADKDNYNLYLRPSTATGDFATNEAGVIAATPGTASTTDGLYDAAGLVPGVTYKIYSNAVGGGSNADWKDSGKTVSLANFGGDAVVVTYHDVNINGTSTVNTPYTVTDTDDVFFKTVTGAAGDMLDGAFAKPTATLKDKTTKVADPDNAPSTWVQEGTAITLTYPKWDRDYDLTWSVGTKKTDETAAATDDHTVNDSTTVTSQLTLNTYTVALTVEGSGTLDRVTITDEKSHVFTTDMGAWHATGAGTTGAAFGAGPYTFTVPAGTYTVKGHATTGTTLEYYKIPANDTTEITDDNIGSKTMAVTDNSSTFLIKLSAVGKYMQVEDDQKPVDGDKITAHNAGTAYVDGTTVSDPGTAGSTIHLPYGYSDKTVAVQVRNTSSGTGNDLFDVTWTPKAANSASITAKTDELAALNGDNNILVRASDTDPVPYLPLTLTVAAGLDAGTYTYAADVTFNSEDGVDTYQPKVTYTLTVVVEPTEFKKVTVVGDKNTPATDMLPLGEGLKFDTFETGELNDWDDAAGAPKTLTTDDYTYQWYYGTEASPTVTWDASGTTATVTVSGDLQPITGQTAATLSATEIAKYPGKNIYLVISAVKDKNVIEAAISDPVATGFQPVVKIEVDGTDQSTVADFAGDGYAALLNDGTKDYKTVWSATAGGFVPVNDSDDPISLPSNASLTVKVAPAKGLTDTAKLTALTGATLTLADPDTTAAYFTVNAVETRDFEAITGLGETFAAMPEMQFALGADEIDDATPVLSGQKVTAKIKSAWTEDYKLTWHTATGATAPDPDDNAYVKTDSGNKTMTALGTAQASGVATTTGSGEVTVSAKTYIGGRLDQNTYTIVSKVSGPSNASIKEVKGDQMDGGETSRRSYTFSGRAGDAFVTSSVGSSATILRNNETVTFTVVKGKFDIAATPSDGTVITSIKWEKTGGTANDGAPLTNMDVAATGNSDVYDVTITVVASNVSFAVSDDQTPPVTASSPDGHGDNEVTRYFSHIGQTHANAANSDKTFYDLTLTNPGNKDLTMSLDVFHYDTMPTDFSDPTKFLDADKVYSATDPATNKAEIKLDTDGPVVLTLGNDAKAMMIAGATLPKNNGTVDGTLPVGTLILGEDARAKDTGVFVFRFKGETDVTTETCYAYYVLDLTIDQLPIVKVVTSNDGSMVGEDDVISVKGYDADPDADQSLANVTVTVDEAGTEKAASTAKLTTADVKFAWVKVAAGAAKPADTAFTVAADGTLASTVYTDITQGASYTLTATDVDHDFYLVAYAPNPAAELLKTNATDMAISDVVKAKRTAGVKVSLDGTVLPDTLNAVKPDPGYTVYLVERNADGSAKTFDPDHTDGTTGTWATTWNTATGRYEAPIDEGKTYDVYALTYKDGTRVVKAIDDTLGKQGDGSVAPERTVPYWSVKHTANVAVDNTYDGFKSYLPGGIATSDNALQDALSVKVSDGRSSTSYTDTLTADNVPVLAGVNVQVTVDTTKANKAGTPETWKGDKADYHTLTAANWTDAATNTTSGIAYPTTDDKVVSTDIAVASGIQNKPLSAKLEQKLFTVKFKIVDITDPTPKDTNAIASVTLSPGSTETGASFSKRVTTTADANGSITNSGKDGGIVTFEKVPAGALTVLASPLGGSTAMVSGYTWNDKDDIQTGLTGRLNVIIPGAPDTNQDTENNTIRMVEATSMVAWYDDFVPADGSNRTKTDDDGNTVKDFEMLTDRTGFERIDKNGGPYLSLIKGYDEVTYTVRLENAGTDSLKQFYLSVDADAVANLTFDLTQVKWCAQDGTVKDPAKDATAPFEMASHDYLEFDVTIPADKAASGTDYTGAFIPHCSDPKLGGGSYVPAYHVRSQAAFEDGAALVEYGSRDFRTNQNVSLKDWPTDTGEAEPTFTYKLLTLSGKPEDATDDAATLAKINAKYGTSWTALDAKPNWLTLDPNTGAFSFTQTVTGINDPAEGVNVEVNEVAGALPKDFTEYDGNAAYQVDDEIVLYLEAESVQGETFLLSYTVNVEPGTLSVNGGQAGTNPDPEGKTPVWGDRVDKAWFTYTDVTNQANDAVVNTTDITGANTANGNEMDGTTLKTDGKVLVNGIHTVTWSVAPDRYTGAGTPVNEYEFTVTFTPDTTKSNEIKWDYRPASQKITIASEAPAVGLKFADAIANAAKVVAGTYTDADGEDKTGLNSDVPVKLAYTEATARLNEQITYLDAEPSYTVKLQKIGTLHNVRLELAPGYETKGFVAQLPETLNFTGDDNSLAFQVTLTNEAGTTTGGKWVGEHKIKFLATGYTTDVQADQNEDTAVTATYELTLTVLPKVITKLDVKVTEPKGTPDTVKGKLEGDEPDAADRDLTTPDAKGNTPVDPDGTKTTWTPGPDDTYTGVEVTVEIDPNYIYSEDDPDTDPDNEDITEHTTLTVTDKPTDPGELTVERDKGEGSDPEHIVHIKQVIPYLMHDDVNSADADDKTGPKVDDTRTLSGFTTDDTDLGKYEIHVGSYPVGDTFGKVYDLAWSVEIDELTAIGAKLLNAAGEEMDFTTLTPEDFTASGDKYTLTLDMSEMSISAAKDYTLKLKAVGSTTKGGTKDIESTYTITVKVTAPVPGKLTYDDVKQSNPSDKKEPAEAVTRTVSIRKGTKPEAMAQYIYDVNLNAADHMVYGVTVTADKTWPEGWTLTPHVPDMTEGGAENVGDIALLAPHSYVLDLSGLDASTEKNETVKLTAKGYSTKELYVKSLTDNTVLPDVTATYTINVVVASGSTGGGGVVPSCPHQVSFLLGLYGTTTDPVMDMVADKAKISKEPTVTAVEGWKFLGWSMVAPTGNASTDAERELVVPKDVSITTDTNFYAVYAPAYDLGRPFHEHYVIGYPNGNFGPADNINRASVATIIARAVLPNFVEGADYGNPGGYSDVNGHWAASAIAYCSKYGVFNGYEDGTFRPDQSITRQEFALVMARLDGVLTAGSMPFTDISEAGEWALGGIYTAYTKGWVNGYTDGSFKPLAYIQRDEAVKILNAYLYRGVDEAGLSDLKEYIHSGVASNNHENGTTEYMTWPDVPKGHWAYYEIIEAANDHEYTVDETQPKGYTVPEHWDKCWIDEKWRYHDDLNDGGPTVGLVRTGFRVWTEA